MSMILLMSVRVFADFYWRPVETILDDHDFESFPAISLVDIDDDNDLDLFIGTWDGYLSFFRNVSKKKNIDFHLEKSGVSFQSSFQKVSAGRGAVPFWVDIDGDMDFDLFLGNLQGTITYYENKGNSVEPELELINKGENIKNSFSRIDVGYNSVPFFTDIDYDGDYDLFVGERDGYINFYKNTGDPKNPVFVPVNDADNIEQSFKKIDVGECSYPVFYDVDQDNDFDLFIGNWEGFLFFYRNDGTGANPYFNEINYAFSKKFSFNQFQTEGDSRFVIADFFKDSKIEFLFSRINGKINLFQTSKKFQKLIYPEKKINHNLRMANYYYEIGKEKYLNNEYIRAKLIFKQAKRYNKLKKMDVLMNQLNDEMKDHIKRESSKFKKSFARKFFKEAVENILNENYKKAVLLLDQLAKLYKGNDKIILYYRALAKERENNKKKIIMVEKMDDRALKYYQKGDYKKAVKLWREALALMPENYTFIDYIVECEGRLENKEIKNIIAKLLTKARKYLKQNRRTEAMEMYTRILKLGEEFLSKKEKKEINAVKTEIMKFKKEQNHQKLDKLYKLGNKYYKQEKYEKAINIYRKIIFYNSCYRDVCEKLKRAKEQFLAQEKAQ